MIKIMHIITRLDMGGSAQTALITCRELAGKYRTVMIHGLALESRMTASEMGALGAIKLEATRAGVSFKPIASLVRRIHLLRDFQALFSLMWHIQQERPDVVHTHTSKAGILGRLAARLMRVPHIVHTPHGHVFYGHFGRFSSGVFLSLEKYFAAHTDRIIVLTDEERKDYLRLGVGAPENLIKIHSGVDLASFSNSSLNSADKKRVLGLDPQAKLIGFAGWLQPIKGPMHLLNAMPSVWKYHSDATLVFVGQGELEEDLHRRAQAIGAGDRAKFLGWREDIAEVMQLFDVFVLPSLNEGMGRVLVEAMAAGKPVVASRVGGVPEVVRHGETGILVAPCDKASIAEAISQLLSHPAKACRMGEKGRMRCREFSMGSMVEKIDILYQGLLGASNRAEARSVPPTAPQTRLKRAQAPKGEKCQPVG